jgi:hypothetical protein
MASPKQPTLSGRRYSASNEASRREEIERIKKMTPLERIGLALALGRRRKRLMEQRQGKKRG